MSFGDVALAILFLSGVIAIVAPRDDDGAGP